MKPDVVVDIGNTLTKWGRCEGSAVADKALLPHTDSAAWHKQLNTWSLQRSLSWVVSGVQPNARDALVAWLKQRGDAVLVIEKACQLPVRALVDNPDWVGIDRLLNAVAVNTRRAAGVPAVIVGAGTAITVDWVNATGDFCGGAILPGIRMMTRALHDYTALLPLIEVQTAAPQVPANSTLGAMEAGVFWAAAGGVAVTIQQMFAVTREATIFLTGGDAHLLEATLRRLLPVEVVPWPLLTLEGVRVTAESMP